MRRVRVSCTFTLAQINVCLMKFCPLLCIAIYSVRPTGTIISMNAEPRSSIRKTNDLIFITFVLNTHSHIRRQFDTLLTHAALLFRSSFVFLNFRMLEFFPCLVFGERDKRIRKIKPFAK